MTYFWFLIIATISITNSIYMIKSSNKTHVNTQIIFLMVAKRQKRLNIPFFLFIGPWKSHTSKQSDWVLDLIWVMSVLSLLFTLSSCDLCMILKKMPWVVHRIRTNYISCQFLCELFCPLLSPLDHRSFSTWRRSLRTLTPKVAVWEVASKELH